MTSVAPLKRITAAQLSDLILSGSKKLAIVDVRDDDHIGGHIKGSLHYPSGNLDVTLPTLVRKVQDSGAEAVVFHCALSQQRGPSAALQYAREIGKSNTPVVDISVQPQVYVLDQGFVGWQEIHGEDERLTENFRREIWRNGRNPYL
ncbi:phosphoprotein phosphatase-like protein [Ophiostoma piceae UAMH 11346]|uniref:Phosphoprotein phosphatase-like protein n=1 Tax=Ophiostoma piceae (strain UAMH 11346) TaxID=1262450 RepID=S3CJ87_OPHP1|nr:phosphoprotein phosphatase-like protein [Ophiostoma piceae UAMH 11346]